jgi:hypothetical protein
VTVVTGLPANRQVVVRNIAGEQVATGVVGADGELSVADLPPGDYTLQVTLADGTVVTRRVQVLGQAFTADNLAFTGPSRLASVIAMAVMLITGGVFLRRLNRRDARG